MKKSYYLLLGITIYILLSPVIYSVLIDDNSQIHSPYRHDEIGTFQQLEPPFVAEEARGELYDSLATAVKEIDVNLFFRAYNTESAGVPSSKQAIVVYYLMGNDLRLQQLPFKEKPGVSEFNHTPLFYSSDYDPNYIHGKLELVSKSNPTYLGALVNYEGSLREGELYLLDSTPEKTEKFLSHILTDTGLSFNLLQMEKDNVFYGVDFVARYLITLKNGIRSPQILMISTSLAAMLLVYLNRRKRYSIRLLLGYKYKALYLLLLQQLVLPTLIIAGLTFLPILALHNLDISLSVTPVLLALTPLLFLFVFVQALLCAFLLLDIRFHSPINVLKHERNQSLMGILTIGLKVFVLALSVPLLIYHFYRFSEVVDYYTYRSEMLSQYEDVWLLDSDLVGINLADYDYAGERQQSKGDGNTLSWYKYFYDLIRDDYPVVISSVSDILGNEKTKAIEMRVNGNFVQINQLKDLAGNLLAPTNESKMVLMSEDRQPTRDFLKTEPSLSNYLSTVVKRFEPDGIVPLSEIEPIEPIVLEKNIPITPYIFDRSLEHEGDRFVLVVNSNTIPINFDQMKFVGISEEQRRELLQTVSVVPFSENLKWITFSDYFKRVSSVYDSTIRTTLVEIGSVVFALIFYSLFSNIIVYEWLARRITVSYLFGRPYWASASFILLLNILISILMVTIMVRTTPIFNTNQIAQVYGFILILDIVFFGSSHFYYSRKTLKNLTMRE
ncbi:MAG: hypothetical protein GX978_08885 [Tissierellia bacterium]|nr:hypothetical protein [Tissierellia bacterium]